METGPDVPDPSTGAFPWWRLSGAFGVALLVALGAYLLLEAARPTDGLVSFSFLLLLPAALSAFVSYVADPWGRRSLGAYLLIPAYLLGAVVLGALIFAAEGVICVLLLSPLWMASGMAGAATTWSVRRRVRNGRAYCLAWLAVPAVAMQVEPLIALPVAAVTVTRSATVAAIPARLWPLLRGIPDVRPDEGRWTFSQDVVGVPRPIGARLVGEGVGAERLANWGAEVRFRERIVDWAPGERIAWRFFFDDLAGWRFTDRHLMPDSPYFRVTDGGYTLAPAGAGRTRVTLRTRYLVRTPVNGYAAWWGEVFLGDLENNLLAIVKGRAERR